jgi:hypothetical protein
VPSLFTLRLDCPSLGTLAGVSADPVGLELRLGEGGPRFRQRGAVLLTHWGLSGPATLRLTAFAARDLRERGYRGDLLVDWTGGMEAAAVTAMLTETRQRLARRQVAGNRPWPGLSRRLWALLVAQQGLAADLRWAELSRAGQRRLEEALRRSVYRVVGRGPFGEEFVTAGGIPLAEVNLATMESRRQTGLYLVGELLDVDGVTGGFNFQHCWSSGWLAGRALAAANGSM